MSAKHLYRRTEAVLVVLMLFFASAVSAEETERTALKSDLQRIDRRLVEIEREVLREKPSLKARHGSYRQLMLRKMQNDGYPAMARMRRLSTLRERLREVSPGAAQHDRLVREYRKLSRELLKAQRQAMDEKKIRDEREGLLRALKKAMREYSTDAAELLDRRAVLRQRLTARRRAEKGEFAAAIKSGAADTEVPWHLPSAPGR